MSGTEKQELREKFIFLNNIPLIVSERNAVRQFQIEVWLEPDSILKALNITKLRECQNELKEKSNPNLSYIR